MNRVEELERTVQVLIDAIDRNHHSVLEDITAVRDQAADLLAGHPCNCVEFSFPHKRTVECFRRYLAPSS